MPDDEDWLWRPVAAGLCKYESIIDGTLDLGDIKTMNNILDVREANEEIARGQPVQEQSLIPPAFPR